jgi:uncharacterized lipoprotein
MRFFKIILITAALAALAACGSDDKPASPVETLKAYTIAVKKKDVTTMKLLLSEGTLKLHQQEAKAQNVTLDDIVLRDTLFPPDQRIFDYRNEKIEGDKASVEVKNNFDSWDVISLVREDGIWKIDKKATSEQMIQEVETSTDDLDDLIQKDMEEAEKGTKDTDLTDPNATPTVTPENPADPSNAPPAPGSDPAQTPSAR